MGQHRMEGDHRWEAQALAHIRPAKRHRRNVARMTMHHLVAFAPQQVGEGTKGSGGIHKPKQGHACRVQPMDTEPTHLGWAGNGGNHMDFIASQG